MGQRSNIVRREEKVELLTILVDDYLSEDEVFVLEDSIGSQFHGKSVISKASVYKLLPMVIV